MHDVAGVDRYPVEPVRHIHLQDVWRTMAGVGFSEALEEAPQRPSELHGFRGHERQGVVIDPMEGVIDDRAGLPCMLGDDPNQAES